MRYWESISYCSAITMSHCRTNKEQQIRKDKIIYNMRFFVHIKTDESKAERFNQWIKVVYCILLYRVHNCVILLKQFHVNEKIISMDFYLPHYLVCFIRFLWFCLQNIKNHKWMKRIYLLHLQICIEHPLNRFFFTSFHAEKKI